ncbi:MAG TPA: hypothetical protein VMA09_05385 [Candidatus Binataceae bacterium]|nr:hypothetical protein [Candidatus Binataceae bacterium]
MSLKLRDAVASSVAVAFLAIAGAATAHAFTLPAFSPDIKPVGLSVSVSDKQVTPKVGPTSDSSSFVLYTPFNSVDFDDDICNPPSNAMLIIGLAPSKKCMTGEPTLTPLTIALDQVTNTDCESFEFMSSPLTANWTITANTPPPPPANQNQSVSCINGVCTVSGGGTSIISSGDGTQTIVVQNGSGNTQTPASDVFSFNAASTTPGLIAVPSSKVDAFILYTADGDSDDSGSGYEGACVTLNSTSISTQTKIVNGTRTVTKFFGAH